MWDVIARLLPPPVLLGLLIYALVCFLWLQPMTEARMAPGFVSQCETGRLPSVAVRPKPPEVPPQEAEQTSDPIATPELPLSVQVIAELKSLFRDDDATAPLPYEAAVSACSCAVAHAFDRVFWPSLLHVMSLRSYTPRQIQHFDQYVARELATGSCGRPS